MGFSQSPPKPRLSRVIPAERVECLEPRIAPAAANLNLSALNGANGFKLSGAANDYSGYSVSTAGDLNGDGFDDLIINADVGVVGYVVFGKSGGWAADLKLSKLNGADGFKIIEPPGTAYTGTVSGAGDINGDGLDDIIIGRPGASPTGLYSGASYVIFGRSSGFASKIELSSLDGITGFRIDGSAASDLFGLAVSGAGDINGDGFADILIGAPFADTNGHYSGSAYVVFGKSSGFPTHLQLSSLDGTTGFRISGIAAEHRLGRSVSGAGDVNGDGLADFIIASGAGIGGSSHVIFGKSTSFTAEVDLASLDGTDGFTISGAGRAVNGAGDVNGDGFDDVIISAAGPGYVVFGKSEFPEKVEVSALDGSNGFKFTRGFIDPQGFDSSFSVSGAGDFNGDGFDDLVIGDSNSDPTKAYLQGSRGAGYVVFGRSTGFGADVNLSALNGSDGFKMKGAAGRDGFGKSVSGAGDINGDGFDDVIIGANFANANGGHAGGVSYVVFGFDSRFDKFVDGKSATFTDVDGDKVTVKLNRGALNAENFIFGSDGTLQEIDLKGDMRFTGANISIAVKAFGGGDGVVDVGVLNGTGLNLSKVTISGTLGTITAGDNVLSKPAIKSLTVGSLGTMEMVTEPLLSEVAGSLGKLTVKGDVRGAALSVGGKLGKVTIGGDLVGDTGAGAAMFASIMEGRGIDPRVGGGIPVGAVNAASIASFTVKGSMNGGSVSAEGNIGSVNVRQDLNGAAVAAAGQIKVVKVFGSLASEDPEQPTLVAALAKVGSTKAKGAVAINNLTVNGDVENAQILLGYQKRTDEERTSYLAKNPDASAGKVLIKGNWTASSLVAGVFDATGDGFGLNDELIPGDTTDRIVARIASIVIKGTATGSTVDGDHFAITAQQIGKLSINGEKISLNKSEKDDILLDRANGDFRVIEI